MTDDPRTLEQVLADYREEAAVLRVHGHRAQAESMDRMADDIATVMVDYLTWLSEDDAMSRSGRGKDYLRARFGGWLGNGMAEFRGRVRYFRACVIPVRVNLDLARGDARRLARAS